MNDDPFSNNDDTEVGVGDALAVVDMQVNVGHDTAREYIVFENQDDQPLDLGGYVVTDREDGTGIEAVFPDGFTLYPGEQVRVCSGARQPFRYRARRYYSATGENWAGARKCARTSNTGADARLTGGHSPFQNKCIAQAAVRPA